jgi:hypothetical protein
MTPSRTRRRPPTGPRAGCSSPRSWPTVCPSSPGGWTPGPCPRGARPTANAAPVGGAYRPSQRTPMVPGSGTCTRERRLNSAMATVSRPCRGLPACAPLRRYSHVPAAGVHDPSRWLALGPPGMERATSVRTPGPCGYRSRRCTGHGWRPRGLRQMAPCRRGIPSGHVRVPCWTAASMAASCWPRKTAITTRTGSRKPWRPGGHGPRVGMPTARHHTVERRVQHHGLTPGLERGDEARTSPQLRRGAEAFVQRLVPRGNQPGGHHAHLPQPQPSQLIRQGGR